MPSELEYKRAFRRICGVWSEVYETRSGSGIGYPDTQLLAGGLLLPVELKVGQVAKAPLYGDILMPREIKPSQISWHHGFKLAGGTSFVLVCCGPVAEFGAWATPSVDRYTLSGWKEGWLLSYCQQWVSKGKLVVDLKEIAKRAFHLAPKARI